SISPDTISLSTVIGVYTGSPGAFCVEFRRYEPERWSTTLVLHRKGLTRSIPVRVPPQLTRKEKPSNESGLASISLSPHQQKSLQTHRSRKCGTHSRHSTPRRRSRSTNEEPSFQPKPITFAVVCPPIPKRKNRHFDRSRSRFL